MFVSFSFFRLYVCELCLFHFFSVYKFVFVSFFSIYMFVFVSCDFFVFVSCEFQMIIDINNAEKLAK